MLKKRFLPLLAVLLILAQALTGLFTGVPKAAAEQDLTALKQYSYYAAFRSCLLAAASGSGILNSVDGGNEADIMKGSGPSMWAEIGYVVSGDGGDNDGGAACSDLPGLVMNNLGISSQELMKGLGYTLNQQGNQPGWWVISNKSKVVASWDALASSKGIPTTEPAGYSWYYLAMAAYQTGCKAQSIASPTDSQKAKATSTSHTDGYGWVMEVTSDGSMVTRTQVVYQLQGKSFSDTVHAYPRPNDSARSAADNGGTGSGNSSCGDLLTALDGVGDTSNDASVRYANYLQDQIDAVKKKAATDVIGTYCQKTYPSGQPAAQYQNCIDTTYNAWVTCSSQIRDATDHIMRDRTVDERADCMAEQGVSGTHDELLKLNEDIDSAVGSAAGTTVDAPGSGSGSGTTTATCTGGSLGWILCPLVVVFTDVINTTADFLNSMLVISPIGSNADLQKVWSPFVGIANLLLVVAFLVVIFSQATSFGLDAYGIKKMLPRIIAAAILINLSYFICTIALDVTNVIGGAVGNVINSLTPSVTTSGQTVAGSASWQSWVAVGLGVFTAGTVLAAVGAIAFIIPLLLSAAFAVVAIFLIIALRHVAIILLVIIAPLAFAAMILPNTESLFTKWRKFFVSMLVMYPVVMFIMYGSKLVGALIMQSNTTVAGTTDNVASSWITEVVAVIVMTVGPFILLYMYLKNSNKLMGMAAGAVGKMGSWGSKKAQGWAQEKKDRSTYQQMKNSKKNSTNTAAQRRAIQRFGSEGAKGFLARRGAYGVFGKNSPFKYQREGNILLGTQADKAIAGIQREQREIMAEHTNRPTMDLVGRGFQLNKDNKSFTHIETGKQFSLDQISNDSYMKSAGITGVNGAVVARDALDAATLSNMTYMRDNDVLGTTNGVKMATEAAYQTGAMDTSMLKEFNSKVSMGDRGEFIEFSNAQAHAKGLTHLGFTSTDDKGDIITGGRLGGMKPVAEKMLKSFGTVSKDMWGDTSNPEWTKAAYDYVLDVKGKTLGGSEVYKSELAKMDDQQAKKFLGLMNARQQTLTKTDWMSETAFAAERSAARKQYAKA